MHNSTRYTLVFVFVFLVGMFALFIYDVLPQHKANSSGWKDESPNVCEPEKMYGGECFFSLPFEGRTATVTYILRITKEYAQDRTDFPYLGVLAASGTPVIKITAGSGFVYPQSSEEEILRLEDVIQKRFALKSEPLRPIFVHVSKGRQMTPTVFISVPDMSPSDFEKLRTYLETAS